MDDVLTSGILEMGFSECGRLKMTPRDTRPSLLEPINVALFAKDLEIGNHPELTVETPKVISSALMR